MPSLVNFENDPSSDSLLRGLEAGVKARHAREQVAVDQATRAGVGEMLDAGGSAGYQTPSMAPQGIDLSSIAPPVATPAATPPQPRVSMAPRDAALDPEPVGASAPPSPDTIKALPPGTLAGVQGAAPTMAPLSDRNNNPGNLVFAGQPGATRDARGFAVFPTRDAGMAANDANLAAYGSKHGINTIAGVINRWAPPNAPGNTPESTAAYVARVAQGTGIDPNAPINLADPAVRGALLKVMYAHEGGAGSIAAGGAPVMAPGASFAPDGGLGGASIYGQANPNFNARYDPILRRLADAPGGGDAALKIMAGLSRYDMQNNRRLDAYQKYAMQAFARGDIQTGQYYAQQGGMQVPPWFGQDMVQTRRASVGALLANRIYGGDTAQSQAFTQAYMQNGDAGRAFQAAGQPTGRTIKVEQVYNEETQQLQYMGIARDGQAFPLRSPDGTPLTGGLKPANSVVQTDQGPQVVNRNAPAPTAQPITGANGAPVQAPAKTMSDKQTQVAALVAVGSSPVDAWAIVNGNKGGVTPSTITGYRSKRLNTLTGAAGMSPEKAAVAVDREMDDLFGAGWRSVIQGSARPAQGGAGGAGLPRAQEDTGRPAAAAPAAIPQRPASVPTGSAWSPSRRMWRTPAGQMLDQNGAPIPEG